MEGYMDYGLSRSNWAEAAVSSGAVRGFLFGRIDGLEGARQKHSHPFGELPWISRSLLKSGYDPITLIRFVSSLALTEFKTKLRTPDSGASIEMFIVDPRHEGKGIGTALLTRFSRAASEAGASLVTVATDDTLSTWQFYERKGFKRVATFHDNISSSTRRSVAPGWSTCSGFPWRH